MSIVLNIDSSIETATVCIARDGIILAVKTNESQKEHASFLHQAIKDVLESAALKMDQVDAIAVTGGPGSYTGIRVGMATAKGLAFALKKPFITIGTLNMLASAAIDQVTTGNHGALYAPMIDARRMEVYTAVFDANMKEVLAPAALILDSNSFSNLSNSPVYFFGSGAAKWKEMNNYKNAIFLHDLNVAKSLAKLSHDKLQNTDFTDLAYSEPFYVKEFYSP